MARPSQKKASRFIPFGGVGHRLGEAPKIKKMGLVRKGSLPATGRHQNKNPPAALKPTLMGRIIGDQNQEAGCATMMQNGLDWWQQPRGTRSNPVTPAVTRKTKETVVAISRKAEGMLTAVFGSADIATRHAKRKTLKVEDMTLVNALLSKCGSYSGLLSL
eukprot:234048-Prymnesium_polylepis.2